MPSIAIISVRKWAYSVKSMARAGLSSKIKPIGLDEPLISIELFRDMYFLPVVVDGIILLVEHILVTYLTNDQCL